MTKLLRKFARFLKHPLSVWAAFVGILLWNWFELWRGSMHPPWWPIISLVLLLIVGTIALFSQWVVALAKRENRLRAFQRFLLGTIPLWLIGAHVSHVYITTMNRMVKIDPLTLVLMPMSSVVGEIEANLRYRSKTTGQRVVMFHNGTEDAESQVAAADRYLSELDTAMGRPPRATIYWVRGPLLGREHYSFGAMAMGTESAADEFTVLDRHELAHAAIGQHITISTRTPMVLVEGWAEACSIGDPERLWSIAAEENAWSPTLAELTSPPWTWIDLGPVYTQGGALVQLLIDEYGYEKFVQLCMEGRPEDFGADCERILDTTLDDLQAQFDRRIAKWSEGTRVREVLEAIAIGENINTDDWIRFIDEYVNAVDRDTIGEEYELRIETQSKRFPSEDQPEIISQESFVRAVVAGDLQAAITDSTILVISPEDEFELSRSTSESPWKLKRSGELFPAIERWNLRSLFASSFASTHRYSFRRHETWNWKEYPPTLTEFRRERRDADEIVQIKLERFSEQNNANPISLEATYSAQANWRVIERLEQVLHEKELLNHSAYSYRFEEDRLAEIEIENRWTEGEGQLQYESTSLSRFDHAPQIDPTEYTREAFGIAEEHRGAMPKLSPFVITCLIAAGVQIFIGLIPLRRKPQPS